jgi:hypothetical protein
VADVFRTRLIVEMAMDEMVNVVVMVNGVILY